MATRPNDVVRGWKDPSIAAVAHWTPNDGHTSPDVLALPDAGMAGPTGVGHALTTYSMPIEGRDEWVAAAARHFG
jgi:hypothetical protein